MLNSSRFLNSSVVFAVVCGSCTVAVAQPAADADYTVQHNFRFQPSGDVVEVWVAEFRHAWIRTPGVFGSAWGVQAAGQDPLFDPFGTESFGGIGIMVPTAVNSGLGMPVACVYNNIMVPPAGHNSLQCLTIPLGPSFATACTDMFVASYSPLPPFDIQGVIRSSGNVHAVVARAYAFSSSAVSVRGGIDMGNGRIQWSPTVVDVVGDGRGAVGYTDPIHFVASNLDTGDVIDATLLDYSLDSTGDGMVSWDLGVFETDRQDLEFVMEIPGAYVLPGESGEMHLKIEHGQVTVSDDTGVFDGMLPAVGSAVPLVFPLPNDIVLNYDLGLDPIFNWEVLTDLSGGGGALADSWCAADLNGDGELDFFDVSLFLSLFGKGDLAADFTGDEELDFFDVSAFLAAFSDGCAGGDGDPGL